MDLYIQTVFFSLYTLVSCVPLSAFNRFGFSIVRCLCACVCNLQMMYSFFYSLYRSSCVVAGELNCIFCIKFIIRIERSQIHHQQIEMYIIYKYVLVFFYAWKMRFFFTSNEMKSNKKLRHIHRNRVWTTPSRIYTIIYTWEETVTKLCESSLHRYYTIFLCCCCCCMAYS